MNTQKFFSRDDIALIKQNIKAGVMTLDDIHLIIKNELNGIYNTILSSLFFGSFIALLRTVIFQSAEEVTHLTVMQWT